MGSKSEKKEFTNIFTRFFQPGKLKYLDAHKMRAKVPKSYYAFYITTSS